MTSNAFHALFGRGPRKPETKIEQFHMDIARSIQEVTEEVMVKTARHARKLTGQKNLCLAGGVALNCVGNGKILREAGFERIWIQPAAGDAGGALGAALVVWHHYLEQPRAVPDGSRDQQKGSLLGPDVDDQIKSLADQNGWVYEFLPRDILPAKIAQLINDQKVIGLCQGKMEFGPRALGSRSIIGDPRSEAMQTVLNLKVKFRESFRPFAPAVLRESCSRYFDLDQDSPYMLLVAPVQESQRLDDARSKDLFGIDKLKVKRSLIPAVTHVDYSARVQTVDEERNPLFYKILKAFEKLTGCGVLINTSLISGRANCLLRARQLPVFYVYGHGLFVGRTIFIRARETA